MAINSNNMVQNEIEPINASTNLTVNGRNVASTTIENTTKIAALMMTRGEYLRRLEQLELRMSASVFPHLAFIIAVVTNSMMANISAKGTIALTYCT